MTQNQKEGLETASRQTRRGGKPVILYRAHGTNSDLTTVSLKTNRPSISIRTSPQKASSPQWRHPSTTATRRVRRAATSTHNSDLRLTPRKVFCCKLGQGVVVIRTPSRITVTSGLYLHPSITQCTPCTVCGRLCQMSACGQRAFSYGSGDRTLSPWRTYNLKSCESEMDPHSCSPGFNSPFIAKIFQSPRLSSHSSGFF